MEYELHPLCTLFPRMSGKEFDALISDIKANGQREPIIIHEGMILDGGNRYRACLEAGVKPQTMQFGGGNLVAYVLSVNLHRRHMTAGQQAAIVASAQDWAMAQTVGKPKSGKITGLATVSDRTSVSGVSDKTQRDADRVAKADPELAKQVAHGEISLPKAIEQIIGKRPGSKPEIVPDPTPVEPSYSELDAANDQISELQSMLALARLPGAEKDASIAEELIAGLRAEIKTLTVTLAAVTQSRNNYQAENAELRKQIQRQRREIDKATGRKTA